MNNDFLKSDVCPILQFKVAFSEETPVYFTFVHTYFIKQPPIRGCLGFYSDGGVVGALCAELRILVISCFKFPHQGITISKQH